MPKLTEKQKKFCKEYLIDLNATQSAIRAGYSPKTAGSTASENLKKPEIQNYLSKLMQERSERTGITADNVLKEIQKVAFSDTKISGREKLKALELIGKHCGIFDGQNQESGEKQLTNLFEIIEGGISKK